MRRWYEKNMKKKAEVDMEAFLANFDKDLHGKITPPEEIKLPPLGESAEPSVSENLFTSYQIAVIQSIVNDGNNKFYNTFLEL